MSARALKEILARSFLSKKIRNLIATPRSSEQAFRDKLEEILIEADVSLSVSSRLIDALKVSPDSTEFREEDVLSSLKEEMLKILSAGARELNLNQDGLSVILVVGVNGVGKTTTIGKLANTFRLSGKRVILAASDTFRPAAIEQLEMWAKTSGAGIVKQKYDVDPAAVAYDAVIASVARRIDILIIDTAGRLHTRTNLMEELRKIKSVLSKALKGAPHEVLLVLDAATGQNALIQARLFKEAVEVNGIVIAKMDGTAKGGIILSIEDELSVPVKLVGTGEKPDDLMAFIPEDYIDGILSSHEVV